MDDNKFRIEVDIYSIQTAGGIFNQIKERSKIHDDVGIWLSQFTNEIKDIMNYWESRIEIDNYEMKARLDKK